MAHVQDGPVTVTEFVTHRIRERILTGEYAPGAKLDQHALVKEFNASLIPVRESLRQLDAQGFIRLYPHRGAFVAGLSITELKDIYFVREVLEESAAQRAVPNLGDDDKAMLKQLVRQMTDATAKRDYARLLQLNRDFHFGIYQACGNDLLLDMIQGLWDRSSRYRHLYTFLPGRAPRALAEHKAICAACIAGNAEKAGSAVRKNVRQTVQGLAVELKGRLENGKAG